MSTTEKICAWEQKHGPYLILGTYGLLVCLALYRMISRKPLTTDPFAFLSIATFVLLVYAMQFLQTSCPGQKSLTSIVRTLVPDDTGGDAPAATPPAGDPQPYVEDAYPGILGQPGPAAPLSDPRSFYGDMDGLQGKRVAPYTLGRGYAHYVPQPI
jgi:hypothetical protein